MIITKINHFKKDWLTKKFLCLFIFINIYFALCSNLFALDVYVANNGDDNNGTGRISAPFKTLQKGVDALKLQGPGNTMFLRGGLYKELPLTSTTRGVNIKNLNDATSWDNAYTIKSYPNEWAIIDASDYSDDRQYIFSGSTDKGAQGFIEFSHLEIRNASGATHSSAISITGGPFKFNYLYIHNNVCGTYSNNPGGIILHNGSGLFTIEYCYFKQNGWMGDNENSANVTFFSDYIFTWGTQQLTNSKGYSTALHGAEVKYCMFDGGQSDSRTSIGIKVKGQQYLMGTADSKAWGGTLIDSNNWKDKGIKIHHNIFINHARNAICNQADFAQIFNNICKSPNGIPRPVIQSGIFDNERAPSHVTIYNNTIIGGGRGGIDFTNNPKETDEMFIKCFVFNNIIDGAIDADNAQDITFMRYPGAATKWDYTNLLVCTNNLFYRSQNYSVVKIMSDTFSIDSLKNKTWSLNNHFLPYSNDDFLYVYESGIDLNEKSRYKINELYSNYKTIFFGGRGMKHPKHPYLDYFVPVYIGAVNPNKGGSQWVDGVLTLTQGESFMKNKTGDPIWIVNLNKLFGTPLKKMITN